MDFDFDFLFIDYSLISDVGGCVRMVRIRFELNRSCTNLTQFEQTHKYIETTLIYRFQFEIVIIDQKNISSTHCISNQLNHERRNAIESH